MKRYESGDGQAGLEPEEMGWHLSENDTSTSLNPPQGWTPREDWSQHACGQGGREGVKEGGWGREGGKGGREGGGQQLVWITKREVGSESGKVDDKVDHRKSGLVVQKVGGWFKKWEGGLKSRTVVRKRMGA